MDKSVKEHGFLLVSVLLITIILFTVGLAFLGKRAIQYRRAATRERSAQAKALAESGLEDALAKLRRDLEFPPLSADQRTFSYSEVVRRGGVTVGSYSVTVDGTYRFPPFLIWVITTEGIIGESTSPQARRTLRAEFDISTHLRNNPSTHNPHYYKVIEFQDLGGL